MVTDMTIIFISCLPSPELLPTAQCILLVLESSSPSWEKAEFMTGLVWTPAPVLSFYMTFDELWLWKGGEVLQGLDISIYEVLALRHWRKAHSYYCSEGGSVMWSLFLFLNNNETSFPPSLTLLETLTPKACSWLLSSLGPVKLTANLTCCKDLIWDIAPESSICISKK